ncbi:MAG: carboxylating nicotinate-nucleotide diphosphorylase [bacterium]|nr:carboxylating nicotinate-nucleotide diphosphorylase [bacterium]
MAREEDLGRGDLTSALLEPEWESSFELRLNQPAALAGRALAGEVLGAYDGSIRLEWADDAVDSMVSFETPMRLATLIGPNRSILAAERVLLNFLQRLCGIATLTRRYVDAVAGTRAKVYDTRKTTPGWRALEKYAVRCGGGHNHRMGLHDAVLIKDNHLAGIESSRLASAVFEMLNRLPQEQPAPAFIMVEADTLEQLEQLYRVVGIDIILLDNFGLENLRRAVQRRDELGLTDKVQLEASGGVTLDTIHEIARTGVDRISVGALTHSATAVDLSLARV